MAKWNIFVFIILICGLVPGNWIGNEKIDIFAEDTNSINQENISPVIEVLPDVSSGIAPLTVHFEGVAYDEDGKICALEWDFQGDGVFDFVHDLRTVEGKERAQVMKQGLQKVHTFENPGIFHVLVRVTDDTETKATTSVTIQVHSDRPYLDIVPSNTEFEFMAQAGYEAFFNSDITKGVKFALGDAWIMYTMKDQFQYLRKYNLMY
ncbi:MAG: PKD domain-containing protein [Candidatus Methanofastidiosia archaeon]